MTDFEVAEPILNSPYVEPAAHWNIEEGQSPVKRPGRRPAGYFYRDPRAALDGDEHAAGLSARPPRELGPGLELRAVLVGGLWLLARITRRFETLLEKRYQARVPSLGIGSFEFIRAERIWMVLRGLLRLVRWVAGFVLAFVCLRYALGQFPHTRQLANDLAELVTGPLAVLGQDLLDVLPDLVFLAILAVLTRWVLRLTHAFFVAVERGRVTLQTFEPEWAIPTYRLARIGIVAFALVVAYPYIPGSGSAAFKGVSLFLGVLFSLGSSSAISNIVAGYMLTYRRAFRVGDTPLAALLLKSEGQRLHLAGQLRRDTWNGRNGVELHIDDAAEARGAP